MEPDQWITLISAVGGSGVLIAILDFFKNRRKMSVETRVAESTATSQVGLVSVQELEAKLGFLNKVISVLETHNVRLEKEVDDTYAMNTALNTRVRELSMRCDKLEMIVSKLCRENGLDPALYL